MGKYTKIKADGGPIKTVRISNKGEVEDVPINTKKYKEYYDSKTLAKASEDPNLLIAAQDLNPYEVKAEKPTWLTFKEEAIKNYPESKFRSEYFLPALRPSDLDSLPQNALDEYNKRINNTVAQRLLKERNLDKNWDAKTQVEAFTPYERDIILNSDYGEDLARNVRLYDSELANKESFSNSNNKADLLRRQTQATGDKLSLQNLPYVGQYIPNILDVTGGIGNMASNLGAAPDNWNRGNYLSAIGAVAAPIGVGRLASVGAPTTAQFVNNVVNPLAGTGSLIKGAGKYLTTQTPLKNVYKLNPKAYHYNLPENTMWRGLGQEGMEDAVSSGVFRSKQDVVPEYFPGSKLRINKEFGTNPYFTPKFKTAATYGDQFIAEVPRDAANWTKRYKRSDWSQFADRPIPIDEGRILQKDWLKGYKQVKPGVNSTPQIAPQQMGINLKGAFQKYPKDKLTPTQLDAITVNNPNYKSIPEYYDRIAAENGKEARRIYNSLYHGGSNWEAADYITAGAVGGVAPTMLGLYGYALAPGTVRNKLDRPESLVDRDTTIDLTNAPMDYAKVNETKDGKVIIGGEFIENANNTVRTAKDWLTATDTYSDKKYPSKDIQSFYGVENGKFKVGKANEFSPNTEIVPRRFGESNINKAVLNGDEMRILDKEGKPIYQNTPNKGKFILYSPSSKKAEFTFINSGKTGVNKVNDFIQKNKDAQYIHLDNGRYEYYGLNKRGLSGHDFKNYYEQDWDREGNPGYNLVVKQYGGYINNDMNRKKYADGGPIKGKKKPAIKVSDPTNLNLHAYLDSLNLHNAYLEQLKYNPPQDVNKSYAASLSIAKDYINSDKDFKSKSKAGRTQYFKPSSTKDKWTSEAAFKRDVPEDAPLIDRYKNLTFSTPTETGLWTTPDLYNQNIAPIGIYYGGKNADDGAWNPIWADPTQPYEYTGDINDVLQYRSKPTIHGAGVKFNPKMVLNAAPAKQKGLNIPSIQYTPKDTNPYNSNVVSRYLPTPQSPTNPIPYDDIQLYSGHQNRDNQGLSVGYVMEDGKRRDIMADEYNAIMNSSVQGGTKLENTNYAMGGMIKRKDGSYSKRGLWDNIRANKGSGKKPTKEMLEQEARIKAKYPDGGPLNKSKKDSFYVKGTPYLKSEFKQYSSTPQEYINDGYWNYRNPALDSDLENNLEYVPFLGTVLGANDASAALHKYSKNPTKGNKIDATYETASLFPLGKTLKITKPGAGLVKSSYKYLKLPINAALDAVTDERIVNINPATKTGSKAAKTNSNVSIRKSKFANGGPLKYDMYGTPIESNIQPSNVERSYYDPRTDTIYLGTDYNQMDDNQKNNLLAHENYHSMQFKGDKSTFLPTDTGIKKPAMMSTDDVYYGYHNRQPIEAQQGIDDFRQANPSFNLAPDDLIYNNVVDYSQYLDPNTLEGGAKFYGDTGQPVDEDFYGKGGYIVTRSKDRKGKTHKVTGPDGTVKYFGDSKLGQHPNDPARKKAFYARHAKNLKGNPHFRAFARKTWADGGYMDNPPNDMPLNLPLKEQNPYLVPEYNQPMANGYILPDINRPRLLPEVNASEYKASYDTGTPDEIQIPTIVGGQYIGNNALERYRNTGEKFKTMKDPTSYSKYYDEYDKLHPKAMAIGGRMNQAQQLNAGKMRTGSEQGNSFGDYAADYGNFLLDGVTGIAEGLTGAEIYNPTYNTKLGKIAGAVNNQSGKMMGKIAPMALNMVAPGVGTAVGMAGKAVGTGLNASKNEEANGQLNLGNSMLPNMLGNNMEGIAQMETMGAAMQFKQGGLMHINEGGTHEQNALGGVPIGPNALVEQGETINNDFVFSDRLKPKGSKKTYAQLSKSVDTKYKLRPDDKLSKEAKQMDLDRLAAQQEAQKDEMSTKYMQKAMACGGKIKGFGGSFQGPISQSMNVTNGQNTLLANGGLMSNFMEPEPTYFNPAVLSNQYGEGGKIHIKPENRGKFTASANRAGMGVQEFAGHVLANKEDYSSTQVKRANFARNASKWKHAMGGNMYGNGGGPIGPLMQDGQFATGYPTTQGVQGINPYIPQYPAQNIGSATPNYDPLNTHRNDWERDVNYMGKTGYPVFGWDSYVDPKDLSPYTYELHPNFNNIPWNNSPIQTSEDMTPPVKTNRYMTPYNQGALDQMAQKKNPFDTPSTMLAPITNPNRITQFSPTPTEQELANYSKQMQGTNNAAAQNPYGEVGNTGYLTNLAGNLVKAGMVATSKPPIYNPSVKFGRMNANPAERLAMQEGRREIQGTKDIIRNNATSSGQYLTNASLMGSSAANKLAGTIGGIRQGYDQQNVGIGNQEAQLNQQITAANNLAKETFRDNRLNQYNKILDSVIGANQQRFATDVHANNFQNQVISLLKTGVYHYGKQDEKGLWEILGPNNEVITKMPKV